MAIFIEWAFMTNIELLMTHNSPSSDKNVVKQRYANAVTLISVTVSFSCPNQPLEL